MKNEKHNSIYFVGIVCCMVSLFSCTPTQRFARLIEKHPTLLKLRKKTQFLFAYIRLKIQLLFSKKTTTPSSLTTIELNDLEIPLDSITSNPTVQPTSTKPYTSPQSTSPKKLKRDKKRSFRDLSRDIFTFVILGLSLLVVLFRK
jgi:hypothetical protein